MDQNIHWGLDTDLSQPITVGKGSILPLRGWCYHPDLLIDEVHVLVDQQEIRAHHGETRLDVAERALTESTPSPASVTSGFWAHFPLAPIPDARTIPLRLRVYFANDDIFETSLGTITLMPNAPMNAPIQPPETDVPLIAICMPTYNPPRTYFKEQIDSIRQQTYPNWVCIINDDGSDQAAFKRIQAAVADDPRFVVQQNETRLGVYHNVEKCLSLVPEGADYVALADQDDVWHSDKLATLAAVLDRQPDVMLVYSDMQIVDQHRKLIAPTYWTTRRNNYRDFATLLLANTVTGAASLFRASLIPQALPFPPHVGDAYHDHWIACTAVAAGSIEYVDRALYEYRQHGSNVIGHYTTEPPRLLPNLLRLRRWERKPMPDLAHEKAWVWQLRKPLAYLTGRVLVAQTLQLRFPNLPTAKQGVLRRLIAAHDSPAALWWEGLKHTLLRHPTLGIQWIVYHALLAARSINQIARYHQAEILTELSFVTELTEQELVKDPQWVTKFSSQYMRGRLVLQNKTIRAIRRAYQTARYAIFRPGSQAERYYLKLRDMLLGRVLQLMNHMGIPYPIQSGLTAMATSSTFNPVLQHGLAVAHFITTKIAPLTLEVSETAPVRRNLLLGAISFKHFFGGHLSVFNLCLALGRDGTKVRMILVDESEFNIPEWRKMIKDFEGLSDFFDEVEVIHRHDRTIPVEVSPQDSFVATSWWSAHVAHEACKQVGQERFVYMSQDFEPLFYPGSPYYALALQSYTFPHYALFSTELLRRYFRKHELSVFAHGEAFGEENSISFENAIKRVELDAEEIARRKTRKLLFYARPDEHAARNMFELGLLGIIEALKQGDFDPAEWEFYGIGSLLNGATINLIEGVEMKLLPKVSLDEYYELMPQFDLGLSLMMTPHPSLLPLDMAAAGMIAVTNTFGTKTADLMRAISPNILAIEPSIDGIHGGLCEGIARLDQIDARVAGAKLNWATTWDECFNDDVISKIEGWLKVGEKVM